MFLKYEARICVVLSIFGTFHCFLLHLEDMNLPVRIIIIIIIAVGLLPDGSSYFTCIQVCRLTTFLGPVEVLPFINTHIFITLC